MNYISRKLIVTVYSLFLAIIFSILELMTPELTMVILAGMSSYNVSNAWAGTKSIDYAGYSSRKFIITILGITLSALAVYFGFMTAGLSQVALASISSYNLTNAWLKKYDT